VSVDAPAAALAAAAPAAALVAAAAAAASAAMPASNPALLAVFAQALFAAGAQWQLLEQLATAAPRLLLYVLPLHLLLPVLRLLPWPLLLPE